MTIERTITVVLVNNKVCLKHFIQRNLIFCFSFVYPSVDIVIEIIDWHINLSKVIRKSLQVKKIQIMKLFFAYYCVLLRI